jgi:hypothetical protein
MMDYVAVEKNKTHLYLYDHYWKHLLYLNELRLLKMQVDDEDVQVEKNETNEIL